MKETILSIAGKAGLYRLVSQGRGMLIVENIDGSGRRIPASGRDRVTSLNDVSMYTDEGDRPLTDIFEAIRQKYDGEAVPVDYKGADNGELTAFMAGVVPDYDRDRVHMSDIRRLIQWYNILQAAGVTDFAENPEQAAE
ncbi:MAG: DUF5606 domain-containing protein [Prevotellaceae bacterium]|nr:DUF5606 domain-containing protein [Prevotellaceae bacterium]